MRLFKLRGLTSAGLPLRLVILTFAIVATTGTIGYLSLGSVHADSLPLSEACRGYTFYQGGNSLTPNAKTKVSTAHCVTYIQDIVNAAYEANSGNYQPVAKAYDKYYGAVDGEIKGAGSGNYNLLTKTRILAFQATFDYSDGTTGGLYKPLSVDGEVGPDTWSALCGLALGYKSGYVSYPLLQIAHRDAEAPDSGCLVGGGAVRQTATPVAPGASDSIKSSDQAASATKPSTSAKTTSEKTTVTTTAVTTANDCAQEGGNNESGACYFWGQGIQRNLTATGAQVTMSAVAPKVSSIAYHSDSEMYVGTNNEQDSVEVNSMVTPSRPKPFLQVDYWKNGGEYIAGFVAINGASIRNGANLPTTGTYVIAVKYVGTQWRVYYDGQEIGYYPESIWGANVFTQAQFVDIYGEVATPVNEETTAQMGNGLLGTNPHSAYFSGYSLLGTTAKPDLTVAGPSGAAAKVYNVGHITATGFHYGGPGF